MANVENLMTNKYLMANDQMPKFSHLIISFVILFSSLAFAEEIDFQATVDRNRVSLGQGLTLNLTFDGTKGIPALELPEMEAFKWRYVGPLSRMSMINGQVSSSITHVYSLVPLKTGQFSIGPFHFDYNGNTFKSNPITIEVTQTQAPDSSQSQVLGAPSPQDLNDKIFIVLEPARRSIYVNEIVPLPIKLYVNSLTVRNPHLTNIKQDGFSLGDFQQPAQYREVVGGINYDVVEYNTSFFALRPGEFKLGPASLDCQLLVKRERSRKAPSAFDDFFDHNIFGDFFGGYESYPLTVASADIPITVLALPEEARPDDFGGTLGDFTLEVSESPRNIRAGDPITLTMAVRGSGNFSTVNVPKLASEEGFKVYDPQIKQDQNSKVFEQVIIPMDDKITEIPQVSFSFFNTRTGKYETITRGPFPINVSKADDEQLTIVDASGAAGGLTEKERLGRDIIYIKSSAERFKQRGGFLYKSKIFLAFNILPLLVYLLLFVYQARTRRLKTDLRYARQLHAPRKAKSGIAKAKGYLAKNSTAEFYDAVFTTLQEYLGDRFHLPSKAITISIIDDTFKNKSISQDILNKLSKIFMDCDMARFAASQLQQEQMQQTLKDLEEVIDYFQRNKV